ncbi:MAG: hypothetical protein EOP42_11850 [Sphingobacteriaceae bacterium]|nr:MAG: hypothetical protein EOP42_11850 [Sphingobacteriaceae bacterium]
MSDFIQDCLSDKATINDIDDYIDIWHTSDNEDELYQFLGMTEDEYSIFVTNPSYLSSIIAAHKEGLAFP